MASAPGVNLAIAEKRFGDSAPLLSGFHLDIAPGTVVALLGPSGIGKSTLLRLLAGIDNDYRGSILVGGRPAASAPPPGFVFQDARLLPWLTAIDNVRIADPDMPLAKASAMLDQVGLGPHAQAYPYQLSGGMQRRVAVARALASPAGLLLLDEPFVSLDRVLVGEMQALLAEVIALSRPTVVLVTHLGDDAVRLADRVIVLDGRPARIVKDLALPVPPALRDDTIAGQYRALLDAP